VEQLRAYASILEVPVGLAGDAAAVAAACRRWRHCDRIVLDMFGCHPRDHAGMRLQAAMLDAADGTERQLLLGATQTRGVVQQTLEGYAPLSIDRVVLTRLDEAVGLGAVLSCLAQLNLQVGCLTGGSRVVAHSVCTERERMLDAMTAGVLEGALAE
jgi:flagellar biosynthesis protein FlhF